MCIYVYISLYLEILRLTLSIDNLYIHKSLATLGESMMQYENVILKYIAVSPHYLTRNRNVEIDDMNSDVSVCIPHDLCTFGNECKCAKQQAARRWYTLVIRCLQRYIQTHNRLSFKCIHWKLHKIFVRLKDFSYL